MVRFGWTASEACPARTDSAAVGRISRQRRRANSDTWQTIHGPIALTDTAVAATVRTVTASGQRRRNCIAARDATPSARSPQNSVRADCHWSPATDSQRQPPITTPNTVLSQVVCAGVNRRPVRSAVLTVRAEIGTVQAHQRPKWAPGIDL